MLLYVSSIYTGCHPHHLRIYVMYKKHSVHKVKIQPNVSVNYLKQILLFFSPAIYKCTTPYIPPEEWTGGQI